MFRVFLVHFLLLPSMLATAHSDPAVKVRIELDLQDPASSRGFLLRLDDQAPFEFPVGFGRKGVLNAGSTFRGGCSLLGEFRVNALLSPHRFEMTDALIAESGKTKAYLKKQLFANMSAIDFDGDGQGGEYGRAFIGLDPESEVAQPFHFGPYRGTFRWYSYALHGTQDPDRVGKAITGGCINLGDAALQRVFQSLNLGDRVVIALRNSKH